MYKEMLVPLDGSKSAEVVLEYARALGCRLGLSLTLLHVYTSEESELAPMHQAYVNRVAGIVNSEFRAGQEMAGIQPKCRPAKAQGALIMGHPAEEILRYADEKKFDLILMATHGRSGIGPWIMGSVASRVLGASKIPVWLVPARIPGEIVYGEWPTTKMLVPLDGSPLAESVLPHVEAIAKQRGAELVEVVLLKVCGIRHVSSDYLESMIPQSWRENVWQEAVEYQCLSKQYLTRVQKQLKEAGLKVRAEVLMGNPASEIVDYAHRNPINLIVMSTHGRSGFARWSYGGVIEKVLCGVSSPIFVVRSL